MGIARLSSNWLVGRFGAVYIETFRNIPLLLQIFFWYFAVLQALPSPRASISIGDSLFINVRGLYMTRPVFEEGSHLIFIALMVALVFSFIFARWAKKKQEATGEQTPIVTVSLAAIISLPLIAFFVAGMPVSLEYPELKGFNFRGGISIIPELAALVLALSIYTASFIAEIVRSGINAVSHGQTEAAMALGRRSDMPIIRSLSTVYIEVWRGVPLITVLFMASVMLPLFMSGESESNKLVRALIGVVMFASAYMAEVVRGGLQAIPKGQYENTPQSDRTQLFLSQILRH